jgi:heme exporter protein D
VLYAVWSDTYTVTYQPGTYGTFTAVSHSGLRLGDVTPAAPTVTGQSGWRFTGWSPVPTATVTGSVIYVAQWTQDTPSSSSTPSSTPKPSAKPSVTPSATPDPTTTPPQNTGGKLPPEPNVEMWALLNLIVSVIGIILVVVVVVVALLQGKKKQKLDKEAQERAQRAKQKNNQNQTTAEQDVEAKQKKHRDLWMILSAVLAIVGIVVFFLTEDWSLPRQWVDRWTIVNIIIFIIELIAIALTFKHTKNKVDYTIHCYLQGTTTQVGSGVTSGSGPVGLNITEYAPTITGYSVIGKNVESLTLNKDTAKNTITFYYKLNDNKENEK